MPRPRRKQPTLVLCDACKRQKPQDWRWPKLCRECGGKLRNIDRQSTELSGPRGIWAEMKKSGLELELGHRNGGGSFRKE